MIILIICLIWFFTSYYYARSRFKKQEGKWTWSGFLMSFLSGIIGIFGIILIFFITDHYEDFSFRVGDPPKWL